jgi:hypothetical protein
MVLPLRCSAPDAQGAFRAGKQFDRAFHGEFKPFRLFEFPGVARAYGERGVQLTDADLASGRLVAPFKVELKPQSAYYLVCPEVIADRPAVTAFRIWLLEQAASQTRV